MCDVAALFRTFLCFFIQKAVTQERPVASRDIIEVVLQELVALNCNSGDSLSSFLPS